MQWNNKLQSEIVSKEQEDNSSSEKEEKKKTKSERMEIEENQIRESGQVILDGNGERKKIYLLTIIGEIEGHENLPNHSKTTKYEHILPKLASIEDSGEIEGVLLLINTVGGDVSAGLALAEMVASLSKPTVSLVIGDSHSIGVPLTVATDYSFIVPSATMIIHPVRMNGTIIGARQTYDYFQIIQDRIVDFIANHSKTKKERLEEMMMNTGILTKDLGTILVGQEAVEIGLIDELGGISQAMDKLHQLIDINMDEEQRKKENKDHTQTTEN